MHVRLKTSFLNTPTVGKRGRDRTIGCTALKIGEVERENGKVGKRKGKKILKMHRHAYERRGNEA